MYVQSACDAPSDRDSYVVELMRFIDVDSYGQCLHNKDLPPNIAEPVEGMFHEDFLALVGNVSIPRTRLSVHAFSYLRERVCPSVNLSHTSLRHAEREHVYLLTELQQCVNVSSLLVAGNYKFVLAMENAVCDEYVTEKRK